MSGGVGGGGRNPPADPIGTAVALFKPNLTAARTEPGNATAINAAQAKDIQSNTYQRTFCSTRVGAALSNTYVGVFCFKSQPPGQPKLSIPHGPVPERIGPRRLANPANTASEKTTQMSKTGFIACANVAGERPR